MFRCRAPDTKTTVVMVHSTNTPRYTIPAAVTAETVLLLTGRFLAPLARVAADRARSGHDCYPKAFASYL